MAVPVIGSLASLLFGGHLVYDKNSNVDMKLLASASWTPIYVFKEGEVISVKTTLRFTGAPPLPQGKTYNWDRGAADSDDYGIIDADCTCSGSVANDRMPSHAVAVLILKQGDGSLDFNGSGVDSPKLASLPINASAADVQAAGISQSRQNVWADPAEMVDACRVYLTGYDDHVEFHGGFAQKGDYPQQKLASLNDGDCLYLVTIATDAGPTLAYPNTWEPSDPDLNFGNICGIISLVWATPE